MAPPGTKAIIYEDADSQASWAPCGLDTWLLGPSKDHYRCHLYYILETSGYRVSKSADLFSQHCISPPYSHETYIQEMSSELKESLQHFSRQSQTLTLLEALAHHLDACVSRTPLAAPAPPCATMMPEEQRVIPTTETQLLPLQRVTAAPATILANNPTAPCILQMKPCTHQQCTRNNTPSALPQFNWAHHIPPLPLFTEINKPATPTPTAPLCCSNCLNSAPPPLFP